MIQTVVAALSRAGLLSSADPDAYRAIFVFRARVTVLLYDRRRLTPLYAVKISREETLSASFARMKRIYNMLPKAIPEPIGLLNVDTWQLQVTKAWHLDMLEHGLRPGARTRSTILEKVLTTLADLQGRSIAGQVEIDASFRDLVVSEISDFVRSYGDPELGEQLEAHTDRLLNTHAGAVLPVVPQHGDLTMINVGLVEGKPDRVMILDWDDYGELTLAPYDALTFVWSFVNQYFSGLYRMDRRCDFVSVIFSDYCRSMGISSRLAADLFPISIMLYAKLQRRVAEGRRIHGEEIAIAELRRYFASNETFLLA